MGGAAERLKFIPIKLFVNRNPIRLRKSMGQDEVLGAASASPAQKYDPLMT